SDCQLRTIFLPKRLVLLRAGGRICRGIGLFSAGHLVGDRAFDGMPVGGHNPVRGFIFAGEAGGFYLFGNGLINDVGVAGLHAGAVRCGDNHIRRGADVLVELERHRAGFLIQRCTVFGIGFDQRGMPEGRTGSNHERQYDRDHDRRGRAREPVSVNCPASHEARLRSRSTKPVEAPATNTATIDTASETIANVEPSSCWDASPGADSCDAIVSVGAGCSGSSPDSGVGSSQATVESSEYVWSAANSSLPPCSGNGPTDTANSANSPGLMALFLSAVHVISETV